jgi:hypothetical protein
LFDGRSTIVRRWFFALDEPSAGVIIECPVDVNTVSAADAKAAVEPFMRQQADQVGAAPLEETA